MSELVVPLLTTFLAHLFFNQLLIIFKCPFAENVKLKCQQGPVFARPVPSR